MKVRDLKPGTKIDLGALFEIPAYVLSEPAEQPDGSVAIIVRRMEGIREVVDFASMDTDVSALS